MSWIEMSKQSRRDAVLLDKHQGYRSAVSRAYYSAFAAVTHRFREMGLEPPTDRESWTHTRLPRLLRDALPALDASSRNDVAVAYETLYEFRIDADYRSERLVEDELCREALAVLDEVLAGLDRGTPR